MSKARDIANAGTALSSVDATELGYLDGVTSAVQTQLNAKQATVSGVNDTEIGYLDGVTSAIQTQLNQKPEFAAGKNKIINGDFFVNQRAFTSSTSDSIFPFDRWKIRTSGGTGTTSVETFTPGTAPVAGYEGRTFIRGVITGQSAAGDYYQVRQFIEDVTNFAGQTITLSFWAKAVTGTPSIAANFFQNFGTGGSPSAGVQATTAQKKTITTSWARYSYTFAIASISGKTLGTTANTSSLELRLYLSAGTNFDSEDDTLGVQNNTFDIWGVQVESGSTATAFQTATGTIQGELAACQRYYWRGSGASSFATYGLGYATSTTSAVISIPLLQTMRIQPSSVDYASLFLSDGAGSPAISAITIGSYSTNTVRLTVTTTAATQFRPYSLMNAGTTAGFIAFIAEL
jgi:hypothetical protein